MEKYITDERTGLKYELLGDYYLIAGDDEPEKERPIGIWGQRHLCYLKKYHRVRYGNLLTSGELNTYLADMQKIREAGGEAYSYASDYEIIGKLKRFADRHSICIVTVHHTRKQPAGDSFETISGTKGLLGCADGALLIFPKSRAEENPRKTPLLRDRAAERISL